jgi:hypothetical protein
LADGKASAAEARAPKRVLGGDAAGASDALGIAVGDDADDTSGIAAASVAAS